MTEKEADFTRRLAALRDECAGLASALVNDVSRGADRLSEYDRGMIAAAKHIERRIREVKIP